MEKCQAGIFILRLRLFKKYAIITLENNERMNNIRVIELFAGVGSQHQALKNIGIEHEIVAISEIDKFAIKSYEMLHGPVINLGDITSISINSIPDCDLITYSFPCQDISCAGLQKGLDKDSGTRSSLLWECEKIIKEKKPKYLLMENVKNLCGTTHIKNFKAWLKILESMGYRNYWKVLNAVDYKVPQSRERLFCISILGKNDFSFPAPLNRNIYLKDILDKDIAEDLWMNKPIIFRESSVSKNGLIHIGDLDIPGNQSIKRVYGIEGVCPTLTTMTGGNRQPKIYQNGKIRKLSPRECWKVMGWTDEQFDKIKGISNTQLYKQAGNSIAVPVLEAIFKKLFKEG